MSEHEDQCLLFEWAALQENVYPALKMLYAVPNGAKLPYRKNSNGKRYSPEAMRLKREGLKSGVPDIALAFPVGRYHGFYLELKHGRNTASDAQESWLEALNHLGYCAVLAWGYEDAKAAIINYLEDRL